MFNLGALLGTPSRQNRRFLSDLPQVNWAVVEQTSFVAAGRENFASVQLGFYESIAAAAEACRPHVGLVSSSLQYIADPVASLAQISETNAQTLILDRTPIHYGLDDRITLQHVPAHIYPATYPARIFSRSKLIMTLESLGWKAHEEFETLEQASTTRSGFRFTWFGMVLRRTGASLE